MGSERRSRVVAVVQRERQALRRLYLDCGHLFYDYEGESGDERTCNHCRWAALHGDLFQA